MRLVDRERESAKTSGSSVIPMGDSPLEALLAAVDRLDADAAMAMCVLDCRLMTADGRYAEDREAACQLLSDFLSQIRRTTHEITSQWQIDDVSIAEVLASYELADWLKIERLPRAFVVRTRAEGIYDIRVYGANEHRLSDHRSAEPMRVGGRLLLPL